MRGFLWIMCYGNFSQADKRSQSINKTINKIVSITTFNHSKMQRLYRSPKDFRSQFQSFAHSSLFSMVSAGISFPIGIGALIGSD